MALLTKNKVAFLPPLLLTATVTFLSQ